MPMLQPEDARLFAHFCLASRSLQVRSGNTSISLSVSASADRRETPWVQGYARVCEADGVCDVEDEREDDDWHEAADKGVHPRAEALGGWVR